MSAARLSVARLINKYRIDVRNVVTVKVNALSVVNDAHLA